MSLICINDKKSVILRFKCHNVPYLKDKCRIFPQTNYYLYKQNA